MQFWNDFLGWIMNGCYSLVGNYGAAIILFTLVTKIILLPVTIWTYFNSIKMIKIQPDINMLKVQYYGQNDIIGEKEAELQKKAGYNPLLSTIPLIIQLVLLMGVVEVIKAGINNPEINMMVGPISLGLVPNESGLGFIWAPLLAGVASWVLCIAQNKSNILQAEQSKLNKISTMVISVGMSVYLGWFVYLGTVLYWVFSNLFAVAQLYIMNAIIRPRRFVDYEKLEKSRKELASIQSTGKKKGEGIFSKNRRREREDYKRFFSVVNKHLVFYSESNGFYKYFKGHIEYILKNTKLTIHYITSDSEDSIFELAKQEPRIRPYYIGENKLITLMMKMDADMVVMTMPDLNTYHIKRSYMRKDIEYVYVQHGMGSNNMCLRKGCVDNFDTVFCSGPHQVSEVAETEEVYGLPKKNLIEVGYPLIDEIRESYEKRVREGGVPKHERPMILIAPSWQKDNIIDSCLEELLDQLKDKDYDLIVRPHPQEVRLKAEYMDRLKQKYSDSKNIEIQTDFTSNNPIMEADLLITDWSGISWEYAFTTLRPILFINTPMRVMNPEYTKIPTVPLNILLRDQLGKNIDTDKLSEVPETVEYLLSHTKDYHERIDALSDKYLFNHGASAEVGAKYIIKSLQKRLQQKNKKASV